MPSRKAENQAQDFLSSLTNGNPGQESKKEEMEYGSKAAQV
jgi:hypothetical protein